MKTVTVFATLCAALTIPCAVQAEELKQLLDKVVQLSSEGKYSQALIELDWAKKELDKKNAEKLSTFFPDTLQDFQGRPAATNIALGILSVERQYQKGGDSVTVSLTGGSSQGLGAGLAGIGQMAALFGGMQQGGGSGSFRIAGRTAMLEVNKEANSANLTVFLESGSILKFESPSKADGASLKSMAEAFKIADLDTYLKGSAG